MSAELYVFSQFRLDAANRRLERDGQPIELNSRYFDVLTLLVRQRGQLVPKQRFMDEAWNGVPVTDEALTQAVRTIRRQLGDDAGQPRFVETVPKHGYRFIADVEVVEREPSREPQDEDGAEKGGQPLFALWRAGTVGATIAGALGGLIYGLAEASGPVSSGAAGISIVLVYVCMTTIIALLGGAGVSLGIVAGLRVQPRNWVSMVLGGAAGGLIVGATVKLIGVDAFNLLFGSAPSDMTGTIEGLILGAAVGVGVAISCANRVRSIRQSALIGGALTGVAGALVPALGGQMLGGSLELLALSFPNSRLQVGQIGLLFGEDGFGMVAQIVTGALEGILFGGCVVAAMTTAHQRLRGDDEWSGQVSPTR